MITYLFTTLVCEVSARKIMFQVLLDFTIFAYAEGILEMEPITQETDYNSSTPYDVFPHSVHEHDTHWYSNTLKPCCATS